MIELIHLPLSPTVNAAVKIDCRDEWEHELKLRLARLQLLKAVQADIVAQMEYAGELK